MFGKVFEQIFDSSIAEDYNERRMFMDLIVLADPDGFVDMTHEAIARRTNVPIEEVRLYISKLEQPDTLSRSTLEEGRRLVKISDDREWGWKIVNYLHYRRIRDQEARREYFRLAQRKHRQKVKKQKHPLVKDSGVDGVDVCGRILTSPSSSSLSSSVRTKLSEWIKVRMSQGKKPKDWFQMFEEQVKWLASYQEPIAIEILSQSIRNNWRGLFEPTGRNGKKALADMSAFELKSRIEAIDDELGKTEFKRDQPQVRERRQKLIARKKELRRAMTQV